MKQLFSLLLVITLGVDSFAKDTMVSPTITPDVKQSFQKAFSNAKDVNWTITKELYKADFVFNSQYVSAYYDVEGNLLGLTKNILSTQLPLLLENSIKEDYCGYWIADLAEFSNGEGTSYYATLEKGDEKIILKSSVNRWSLTKKIKK